MSDQISFLDIDVPSNDEERLFNALKPYLWNVMEQSGLSKDKLEIAAMKSYHSVTLNSKYLVCRIGRSKKEYYISFHSLKPCYSKPLEAFQI